MEREGEKHPYRELLRLFLKPASLGWVAALAAIALGRQYALWSYFDSESGIDGISPLKLMFSLAAWLLIYIPLVALSRRSYTDDQAIGEPRWWSILCCALAILLVSGAAAVSWGMVGATFGLATLTSVPPVVRYALMTFPVLLVEAALLFAQVRIVGLAVGRDVPFRTIIRFLYVRERSVMIYYVALYLSTVGVTLAFTVYVSPGGTNGSMLNYALMLSAISGGTQILRALFPIVTFRRFEVRSSKASEVFS